MTTRTVDLAPPAARGARRAGSMFVFGLCLFWLTNSGSDPSEGLYHYKVARHFVETGQIGFDQPMDGIFTTAPNGRSYASHEFGSILCLIPTAAANSAIGRYLASRGVGRERIVDVQRFAVSFQPGLYAALTLLFLYLILVEEFGLAEAEAFAGCLLVATSTYFWAYSRNLFDGVLCGLLLIVALRYLLRFGREGRTADILAAFGLLGFAVDTRLSMGLPVIAALGYVVLFCTGRKLRGLACAAVALAPFAAWQLWYNHLRTGNPFVSPVHTEQYAAANALDGRLDVGLIGLLFSPGKNMFVYAPLLLLSVATFAAFWRKHRPAAAFVLAVGVMWLLLHARLRSWYGAFGWGPRHFITILPVIALPFLVSLPSLWNRRWWRAAVLTMAAAGFVLAAASVVGSWHYRLALRRQAGTLDESFVWSLSQNQAADMLVGAVQNVKVLLGIGEPASVQTYSEMNNYASNRINMWWYTLPHAGIPRWMVLTAAGALLVGSVVTAGRLARRGPVT